MKKKALQFVTYFVAGFVALQILNHFYLKSISLFETFVLSALFTIIYVIFNLRNEK